MSDTDSDVEVINTFPEPPPQRPPPPPQRPPQPAPRQRRPWGKLLLGVALAFGAWWCCAVVYFMVQNLRQHAPELSVVAAVGVSLGYLVPRALAKVARLLLSLVAGVAGA